MEWNEEAIGRLRALWAEGHSTAEIGRRLGVTKNAVVGKAHRLDLPARPSPIRRDGNGGVPRQPAPRRVAGPTLPPLSSTTLPTVETAPPPRPVAARPTALPAVPRMRAMPRPFARAVACCWPIGDPGTAGFRFCDAQAMTGKPYCGDHAQLAYVKVRDRREDAA
ncbi:MAG: GcrA cell cycle regulator [Acetobacteraceae bacterium]|nr:GcrA cell cycle regulator [Acetobacteraceae bacterium]MSP29335.1 GcrA cell cycle regulator [Acetobacteraceae bacterium]